MPEIGASLWWRGYHALPARWRATPPGRWATAARMLGRRTLLVRGEPGSRAFYDEDLVRRRDAVPAPIGRLIFGRGGVQSLDDAEHRERKARLLGALGDDEVADLRRQVADRLADLPGHADDLDLHDALVTAYGTAVLAWAGTPARGRAAVEISRELARIVDALGYAGTAWIAGWRARHRTERWARRLVRNARSGRLPAPPRSALAQVALSQPRLPVRVAAVELLNLVRPTVAVAWFGTWAAWALSTHPELRDRLLDDAELRHSFAQEVRRCTPFVPALAGRVRREGELDGCPVRRGDRIVLDVPAVDHDEHTYTDPGRFRPERFDGWEPSAHQLVPQGGGDVRTGHRCPGEPVALALVEETLTVLARHDVTPPADWDPGPGRRVPPDLAGRGWRLRPRIPAHGA